MRKGDKSLVTGSRFGLGFGYILVEPAVGNDHKNGKVSYHSIRGLIVADGSIDGSKFKLDVTIPAGAMAMVKLSWVGMALEGGKDAAKAAGVTKVEIRDGMSIIECGSGPYAFELTR
ncbi:MAG: hypothetical protein GX455_03480 [Phycisphaerae bacterium]|nr:hypothetical protein [Phycisphaerae bacterium]